MRLIFIDPYYDTETWCEDKFIQEISNELKQFDSSLSAKSTNIGFGSDIPAVLIEIFNNIDWKIIFPTITLGGLFMLGDTINSSIDGWIGLSKKLKALISKYHPSRIDEKAALLLIINDIVESETSYNNLSFTVQTIAINSLNDSDNSIVSNPDSLYIITVHTDNYVIVYVIKSNGKIEVKKSISRNWLEF